MQIQQHLAAFELPAVQVMSDDFAQQAAGIVQDGRIIERCPGNATQTGSLEYHRTFASRHFYGALLYPVFVKPLFVDRFVQIRIVIQVQCVAEQTQ